MHLKNSRPLVMAGACLAISILAGCASTVPNVPIFSHPGLTDLSISHVTLLPVVDRRVDKSHVFNYESSIGDKVEKNLRKKGYTIERPGAFSAELNIPNDEVAEMEPHELGVLGSSGTQYMMVVYLDDASSKTALGYSFKVEATAILIDKQSSSMLWKDKGIGSKGQGGLIGCLFSGLTKGESLNDCVKNMLASFPKCQPGSGG